MNVFTIVSLAEYRIHGFVLKSRFILNWFLCSLLRVCSANGKEVAVTKTTTSLQYLNAVMEFPGQEAIFLAHPLVW